jgi:hypothetical protein
MKTSIIAAITLVAGFAIGTFYGWRTGVIDGQVRASITTVKMIEAYNVLRLTTNTRSRDQMIDRLSMATAMNLAVDNGLSPVAMFVQPQADSALLELLASWDLSHSSDPKPLFPANTPWELRLQKVKKELGPVYQRALKRQAAGLVPAAAVKSSP